MGSIQTRPSATSICWNTSVTGNLACWLAAGLVLIGRDRGDVDESDDAIVGTGGGDDGAAVGVADEDGRA